MSRKKITHYDSAYSGPRWQRHYTDVYARSQGWQTRVGRRNREFSTFSNLLGLNTAYDDLHRLDGESPYLRNVRYMGEKQKYQRAQVTSRSGLKLIGSIGDTDIFNKKTSGVAYLELYEGKAIRFPVQHDETLTRVQLFVKNDSGATGRLRVLLKHDKDAVPLCDANIDLEAQSNKDGFKEHVLRFVQAMPTSLDKGTAWLQLEIMDDVEPDECSYMTPNKQRRIQILATGNGEHEEAEFDLPNQDESLREVPAEWSQEASIPMVGITVNHMTPVDFIIGDVSNHVIKVQEKYKGVDCEGMPTDKTRYKKYILSVVRDGKCGDVNFYRTDIETGKSTKIEASISKDTTLVMGAKAKDYFYYVDGYSELQRINLETWKGEVAIASQDMIDGANTTPEQLKAQKGAGLLWHMKNRIYLSGFKSDPNFVQFSLINSKGDGVQYDQYNEYFYSPDQSSKESTSPITAIISDYTESTLMVFREDGSAAFAAPQGLEWGKAQQVDTPLYSTGVARQTDVCVGNGSIYLYNRSEGLRRFSGAEATFQSHKVDNELRRFPEQADRFMFAHANKVWFAFDREGRGYADHTLIYHTILAQQSPWYMDNNVPLKWAIGDQESDVVYAMHANYPAIYIYGDPDTYMDFDSSIEMEYNTSYNSSGDIAGWTILRRVIIHLIANDTRSWFIGVDIDKLDDPAVWRKYVAAVDTVDNGPEAVFQDVEGYRQSVVNCFMRRECRSFNIRVKTYSWKGNSMVSLMLGEVGGRKSL